MIRNIIGCIFIALSVLLFIIEIIGNFKFKYVLNRMHVAGIGDSLALGLFVIGCIVINGFNVTSLKLMVAALVMYFTSPVSSHMLAKLEKEMNPDIKKECEVDDTCRS